MAIFPFCLKIDPSKDPRPITHSTHHRWVSHRGHPWPLGSTTGIPRPSWASPKPSGRAIKTLRSYRALWRCPDVGPISWPVAANHAKREWADAGPPEIGAALGGPLCAVYGPNLLISDPDRAIAGRRRFVMTLDWETQVTLQHSSQPRWTNHALLSVLPAALGRQGQIAAPHLHQPMWRQLQQPLHRCGATVLRAAPMARRQSLPAQIQIRQGPDWGAIRPAKWHRAALRPVVGIATSIVAIMNLAFPPAQVRPQAMV